MDIFIATETFWSNFLIKETLSSFGCMLMYSGFSMIKGIFLQHSSKLSVVLKSLLCFSICLTLAAQNNISLSDEILPSKSGFLERIKFTISRLNLPIG